MNTPFPFSTEDLVLRALEPEDIPELHAILNHPALQGRRYIPWKFPADLPLSKAQVDAVLKKWAEEEKGFRMGVILREEDRLIGHAGCSWRWDAHCPDLSLVIDPRYQRQGYGSQVLDLLLSYLYENTPAHNVGGDMADWNQGALAFALRHGFTQSGCMRHAGMHGGEPFDWLLVDILRHEWQLGRGG